MIQRPAWIAPEEGVVFILNQDVVVTPCPRCGSPNARKTQEDFVAACKRFTDVKTTYFVCANCGAAR